MIDWTASGERRLHRPTLHGILNSSQLSSLRVKLNDCKVNHSNPAAQIQFYMQLKLIQGEKYPINGLLFEGFVPSRLLFVPALPAAQFLETCGFTLTCSLLTAL